MLAPTYTSVVDDGTLVMTADKDRVSAVPGRWRAIRSIYHELFVYRQAARAATYMYLGSTGVFYCINYCASASLPRNVRCALLP